MSGIYLHIPFCKQACYYCDFHFSTSVKKKEDMILALAKELVLRKDELSGQVETIYFGGGTPSLLSVAEINMLLEYIEDHFEVVKTPEITLEANPDDLSADKISELALSGINRLSIGVQSFFDQDLNYMNRAHSANQAKQSMKMALEHFENISIDLIYGLPHLSEEQWRENLEYSFNLGVQHISSYALTVEKKTALDHFIKAGKYEAPNDSLTEKHFKILQEETKKQQYIQYEISNFGINGYFSKHNTSYWQGVDYLGIGPSAHSFDGSHRSWNISNNMKYLKSIQNDLLPSEKEKLTDLDRINEGIMTGLRTIWGVSLDQIHQDYGINYKNAVLDQAGKHLKNGTLYLEKDHLLISPENYFLADGIASDLFLL